METCSYNFFQFPIALALKWILSQGEIAVPSSVVSIVRTGLAHVAGVENAQQFMVSLIRGLGSNLTLPSRESFAKQVSLFLRYRKMKRIDFVSVSTYTYHAPKLLLIFILYILLLSGI